MVDVDDAAVRAIESAFARRSAWYVYPDVVPALDVLRDADFRMGVISNFVWGGPELIHDLELARHFDALTISARVGFQKPHQGIFRHALDALGAAPERALHVGDSYRADIFGARRLGWMPCSSTATGTMRRASGKNTAIPILRVVHDLFELLDLLGIDTADKQRPATDSHCLRAARTERWRLFVAAPLPEDAAARAGSAQRAFAAGSPTRAGSAPRSCT